VSAVFLITGPSAAGKTTVAGLLARRFPRGVHLEGDVFRRSVVSGRTEMTPAPSQEALEQLRLRCRLAAAAADAYFRAGFTVVLEDVVAGDELAGVVDLVTSQPLHVVVLLPASRRFAPATTDATTRPTRSGLWRSSTQASRNNAEARELARHLESGAEETVDEILGLTHGRE
jgi:AAA domain